MSRESCDNKSENLTDKKKKKKTKKDKNSNPNNRANSVGPKNKSNNSSKLRKHLNNVDDHISIKSHNKSSLLFDKKKPIEAKPIESNQLTQKIEELKKQKDDKNKGLNKN